MLNILFYIRKDRKDKNNNSPIYCRITYNGIRTDFSIKRFIPEDRWEPLKGKVKGSTEDSKAINAFITTTKNKIYEYYHKLNNAQQTISSEIIKNLVCGHSNVITSDVCVFVLFKNHNKKIESLINVDYAEGTLDRYETCLKHLMQFVKWKYNFETYPLSKINNEFISEFDFFLRTVRKCANNSSVKYMRNFRKIIKIALSSDLIPKDPFYYYKGKVNERDRYFLTQEELNSLLEKTIINTRLNTVRDIFLFSCYTGLAFIDTSKLAFENIQIGVDGEKWIFTKRTKTKTISNIPLLPPALKLIEKYKDHSNSKGTLFPVLSNQKMNAYLKEIGDICGISKTLTYHIARHTFATTVTLSNGVPLESVSKMLGHKSIRTTQHYAKVIDKKVGEDMKDLMIKLKK